MGISAPYQPLLGNGVLVLPARRLLRGGSTMIFLSGRRGGMGFRVLSGIMGMISITAPPVIGGILWRLMFSSLL